MMIIFGGLITATFFWLAIQNDRKALALIPALSPLYLIRFSVGPIPSTLLEVLVLIALGLWITSRPWTRTVITRSDLPWLAVFASVILIGTLAADNTFAALGIAKAYYIEPLLLFFAFRDRLTKEDFIFGARALGTTAFLLGIFGVFQWATGLGLPIPYDFLRRITSVFPYPNAYGLFVTPLIVFFGIAGALEKQKAPIAIATFLFATLLLSETEAGIVAACGALGLFGALKAPTTHARAMIASIGAVALAGALVLSPIREKLLLQDPSGLVRRSQWSETALLIQDHPLAGVGFNGYPEALAPYHTALQYEIFQYPHNLILNAWVEAGVLNILLILLLAIVACVQIYRTPTREALPLAAAFAILAMFIHGLVDVPFYKNDLAILTAFLFAFMLHATYAGKTDAPHANPAP